MIKDLKELLFQQYVWLPISTEILWLYGRTFTHFFFIIRV